MVPSFNMIDIHGISYSTSMIERNQSNSATEHHSHVDMLRTSTTSASSHSLRKEHGNIVTKDEELQNPYQYAKGGRPANMESKADLKLLALPTVNESSPRKEETPAAGRGPSFRARAMVFRTNSIGRISSRIFGFRPSDDSDKTSVKDACDETLQPSSNKRSSNRLPLSRSKSTRSLLSTATKFQGHDQSGSSAAQFSRSCNETETLLLNSTTVDRELLHVETTFPKRDRSSRLSQAKTRDIMNDKAWLGSVLTIPVATSPDKAPALDMISSTSSSVRNTSRLSQLSSGTEIERFAGKKKDDSFGRFVTDQDVVECSPPNKPKRFAEGENERTQFSTGPSKSEWSSLHDASHPCQGENFNAVFGQVKKVTYPDLSILDNLSILDDQSILENISIVDDVSILGDLSHLDDEPKSASTPSYPLPRCPPPTMRKEPPSTFNFLYKSWGALELADDVELVSDEDNDEDGESQFNTEPVVTTAHILKQTARLGNRLNQNNYPAKAMDGGDHSSDLDRKPSPKQKLPVSISQPEKQKDASNVDKVKPSIEKAHFIEILPSVKCRLRGAQETMQYVQADGDNIATAECALCQHIYHCVYDAEFVLCPECRVLNPIGPRGGGVGLGFTTEEWVEYRRGVM